MEQLRDLSLGYIIRACLHNFIKTEVFDTIEFSQVNAATGESALKCHPLYHPSTSQLRWKAKDECTGQNFFPLRFSRKLKEGDDDV